MTSMSVLSQGPLSRKYFSMNADTIGRIPRIRMPAGGVV